MSTSEIWLVYALITATSAALAFGIKEDTKNKFLKIIKGTGGVALFLVAVPFVFVTFLAVFYPDGINSTNANTTNTRSSEMSDSEEDAKNGFEYSDSEQAKFKGYECTDDCSGHEAGYDWAEENDVCDDSFSEGYSNSFDEGVIAYYEENC